MGDRLVVIGASLSGIDTLCRLIAGLPEEFPAPILITQHVASHSPGLLPHIPRKHNAGSASGTGISSFGLDSGAAPA